LSAMRNMGDGKLGAVVAATWRNTGLDRDWRFAPPAWSGRVDHGDRCAPAGGVLGSSRSSARRGEHPARRDTDARNRTCRIRVANCAGLQDGPTLGQRRVRVARSGGAECCRAAGWNGRMACARAAAGVGLRVTTRTAPILTAVRNAATSPAFDLGLLRPRCGGDAA
jgi:hypothetical protein